MAISETIKLKASEVRGIGLLESLTGFRNYLSIVEAPIFTGSRREFQARAEKALMKTYEERPFVQPPPLAQLPAFLPCLRLKLFRVPGCWAKGIGYTSPKAQNGPEAL